MIDPVDHVFSAPRMDVRQLIWIEQIAVIEEQGQVRRDLRLKDQLAEFTAGSPAALKRRTAKAAKRR